MNKKDQKRLEALRKSVGQDVRFYIPENIMSRWNPEIKAAADSDDDVADSAVINMYDMIGEDWWTGRGMTARIVSSVLNKNKGKNIVVNINSPGGDFFEGLAIYNLLKEHDGEVTVRIIGMAASAASMIAMAGDTIKIADAGFYMIHNAWWICVGNKNEMRKMADDLQKFDDAANKIYVKRSELDLEEIEAMSDDETWIIGEEAIEMGFADQFLDSDEVEIEESAEAKANNALKQVDVAMAKAGVSRNERRHLLKELTSTPGATVNDDPTPCAGDTKLVDALQRLNTTLNKAR